MLLFPDGHLGNADTALFVAEAVLGVMAEGLKQIDPAAHASLAEVRGPGTPALRTHRVETIDDGSESQGITRLIADYWMPVPASKRLLMARFSTPLGDLGNLMLSLFDEFVAAARFVSSGSLRDELMGSSSGTAR